MDNNFCLAPWYSLYIGKLFIKPCCLWTSSSRTWSTIDDIKEFWHGEKMQSIRKQFLNNEIPLECRTCMKRIQPRSVWLDERIGKYVKEDSFSLKPPLKPLQLDFHLSNRCNLQCRSCGSWASRRWFDIDKKLNEINPDFKRRPVGNYELDVSKFNDSKEMFSNLVRFDFKGGEPMANASMIDMIDNLVKWGNTQNMQLSYVSNCSFINQDAVDLWKNFKQVRIVASIDGVGELFEYIRGFDFATFENTINTYDQIENMKGLHNVAVSIYNILDIVELNEYLIERDLKRFPCRNQGSYAFDCNVIDPSYIAVNILPKKYKELALKQFENNKRENLKPFIKWLEVVKDIPEDREQLKLFVQYTNALDEMRGTDFLSIKPEFTELFEEYS